MTHIFTNIKERKKKSDGEKKSPADFVRLPTDKEIYHFNVGLFEQ